MTAPTDVLGPGAGALTVRRDPGFGTLTPFPILSVGGGVEIAGLTIANGRAPFGGGISTAGAVVLRDSVLRDNVGTGAFMGGDGGAISNLGELTIRRTTIRDNQGTKAGAILNAHPGSGTTSVTVEDSTIRDNETDGTRPPTGGAIESGQSTELTIRNRKHLQRAGLGHLHGR